MFKSIVVVCSCTTNSVELHHRVMSNESSRERGALAGGGWRERWVQFDNNVIKAKV